MSNGDLPARRGGDWEATSQALARDAIAAGDGLSAVLGVMSAVHDNADWSRFHHHRVVDAGRAFVLALSTAFSMGMRGQRSAWDTYCRDCAWRILDLWISPPAEGCERRAAVEVSDAFNSTWPALRIELACGGIPERKTAVLIDSNLIRIFPGVWRFFDRIIGNVPKGLPEDIVNLALCTPPGRPVSVPGTFTVTRHAVSRANSILARLQDEAKIIIPWRLSLSTANTEPAVYKIPHSPEALANHLTGKIS